MWLVRVTNHLHHGMKVLYVKGTIAIAALTPKRQSREEAPSFRTAPALPDNVMWHGSVKINEGIKVTLFQALKRLKDDVVKSQENRRF